MSGIESFLRDLQNCWQAGDLDRVATFYHEDVVLLPPDLGVPIEGREAVIESYRQFLDAARLERFEVTGLSTWSFSDATGGATSIAHLAFRIDYVLEDDGFVDTGLEVYTVIEGPAGPLIVWRSQTILDSRLRDESESG